LRNPITGQLMSFMNPGTRTNNILTAGPAANGRDQAGAFSANSDIHLYYITNGSTLATVSSITAPTSGPVLPGGYHSWAYIGAWRLNASTQFQQTVLRGSRVTYMGITAALPGGAATIATAVSVAPFVPAVALEYELADFGWAVSSDGAGLLVAELEIYAQSSVLYGYMVKCSLGGLTPSTSQRSMPGGTMVLPNIGQAFIYRWVVTSGSSPAATLYVPSYRIANGGD
ncbi:MAG TPA: hypothetical protein VFP27_10965, partial [Mycobacterium sp.]|nr:hypothetical protein [Mycobacterium sp.]